jgi:hypothetical protein
MRFDVSPLSGSFPAASAAAQARGRKGADAPAGDAPPIPPEVREQMGAAAQLADDLAVQGRGIRFEVHRLEGSVVATLIDEHAGFQRPMLLDDVLDPGRLRRHLEAESE